MCDFLNIFFHSIQVLVHVSLPVENITFYSIQLGYLQDRKDPMEIFKRILYFTAIDLLYSDANHSLGGPCL